jgi:hypothetical protein
MPGLSLSISFRLCVISPPQYYGKLRESLRTLCSDNPFRAALIVQRQAEGVLIVRASVPMYFLSICRAIAGLQATGSRGQ